jgi:hypothetical protein
MAKKEKSPFRYGVCVAPVGLTLPNKRKRLMSMPVAMRKKDPEHIMMELWAKENTRERITNFGLVPIDGILHSCNDDCGKGISYGGPPACHHLPPNEEEVKIVNATIQWLATNCGRSFMHKFQQEVKKLDS